MLYLLITEKNPRSISDTASADSKISIYLTLKIYNITGRKNILFESTLGLARYYRLSLRINEPGHRKQTDFG